VTETFSAVVTDAAAAQSTAQTITITITGANDAPVASDIAALSTISNLNTYTISDDDLLAVTADVDTGNTLTISDISLDTSTAGAIDGNIFTPASDYDGDAVFTFTVSDGTATDIGTATITVLDAIPLGTADEDTSSISISNSGDAIPGGATISSLSLQSSSSAAGTLTDNGDGSWGFAPTADFNGIVLFDSVLSSSLELPASLTISAVNDVPTLAGDITGSVTEDATTTTTTGTLTGADVDTGDTLTYSIAETSGTYGSIAIDSATGEWTYTLSNTDTDTDALAASASVTETFSAVVTDAAAAQSTAQTITITITGANDAPVSAVIADQSIAEDSTLSFVVPDGSFADVDSGDSLTYTATLADGSELPTWLSFDGNTKTFSGTPTNDAVGNIEVAVTATDSASASISDTYTLTVSNTNDVPTLETTLVDQSATEGTEFSYAIASSSFADVDSGDTLTYTTTQTGGAALPSWLSFDGDTQTFSGTPTAEATLDITVTASDSTAMITDAFSLTVANTNDAPVFTSSASVSTTERTYLADTVTATDEEDDAISYSISGGADSGFFGIDSSSGALTFSGADNVRASSLIALPANASQTSVLFDNFVVDGTTATVDVYVLPKSAGFDALSGVQMNITASSGTVSFAQDTDTTSGFISLGNAGNIALIGTSANLQASKLGTATITDYSASATTTVSGIVFDGGVYGSTSTSSQTMANLTLTPVTAPPINGANGSANADDIYTVEVTATDANSATTAQTLNVTVTATADADHASVTSTWTGTSSADTYTIDEYSGLTITADGGDGGNDTVKLAVLDHVLWDTTSGGTTELTATLVDMEIIDIGNLVSSNDDSTVVTIGDFSTNMTIDSTSAASLIDGNDSQVSIMGTANDIVTLSGTTWDKGVSSNLSSGDYASETLVAWSDGTSTLYIDQDINIVTPDIT
ncbi:MAG: tandem-95 repeat protein, partial [Oceanospirillaceae bacterium]|nr:tandem-95 repeat protein [Oceanospirillaceae bacterium]